MCVCFVDHLFDDNDERVKFICIFSFFFSFLMGHTTNLLNLISKKKKEKNDAMKDNLF